MRCGADDDEGQCASARRPEGFEKNCSQRVSAVAVIESVWCDYDGSAKIVICLHGKVTKGERN